MTRRTTPPGSTGFSSPEVPSEVSAATRIDQLRAAGQALDTALEGARRFVNRAVRRAPERLVLVVDDAIDTRDLYAEGLAAFGFQVQTAQDGLEAMEKAVALGPDAIVMDFAMPNMDGGQAARRLSEDDRTCAIPILLLSAVPDMVPRSVRLGCAAFLAKPCTPQDLGALLHLIIAARGDGPGRPGLG